MKDIGLKSMSHHAAKLIAFWAGLPVEEIWKHYEDFEASVDWIVLVLETLEDEVKPILEERARSLRSGKT